MSAKDFDPMQIQGKGFVIAIKSWFYNAPWADLLYWADGPTKWFGTHGKEIANRFTGDYIVTRSPGCAIQNREVHRVHYDSGVALAKDPRVVAGRCSTCNTINLAYHMGGPGSEIILIGVDMRGDTWYPRPWRNKAHKTAFVTFIQSLNKMAAELAKEDVRVINTSPVSELECFERGDIKSWI